MYDLAVRNTTELRGEILAAARTEFAQYGLAGARIDRIARAAQASKERLYAHFGDKETLFGEVVAADVAEFFGAVMLRPDGVPDFVGNLYDLASTAPAPALEQKPAASIWSTPSTDAPAISEPSAAIDRPVDPALRRLVVAYAARRELLPAFRREALAKSAESALRAALPEVVARARS